MKRPLAFVLLAAAVCVEPISSAEAQESSAEAQESSEESGEQICLSVARGWAGTIADLKTIRAVPVPESFSKRLEGGGCEAWQLITESLVNWHLAFGDETTTTAALNYLESRTRAGRPLRVKLSAESKADLELALAYRFVAMEYARAADFFSSPALLAKARRYAEPSLAVGLALRAPRGDGSKLQPFDDYPDRLWRDLDLQLAVAAARIGGTEADFAAARSAFARNDEPHFDEAGKHAFQYGDGFCDIGDNAYLSEWKMACEEGDFERRAISYWRYRASFSLVAQAAGLEGLGKVREEWDAEIALRLIEAAERSGSGTPWNFTGASLVIADIRFGIAEAQLAKARRAAMKGTSADRVQALYDTHEALDMYWAAAAKINGTDHPGWTKRIGKRFLEASAFMETLRDVDDRVNLKHARQLAWFKTILPLLDRIAVGEVAGNP